MSCNHKFRNELAIEYAKEYNPTTLIVGTFNPEWADNNSANWFYGRTENNYFWSVLPQVYGLPSLLCAAKSDWQLFCKINKIAITDLIECIKTADYQAHKNIISGFSDRAIEDNFKSDDLSTVQITDILQNNDSIRYVYLTRGAKQGIWKKLWKPVNEYCKTKNISCKELLTPSGYAFYQFKKSDRHKFGTLSNFIADRWKREWHKIDGN